MTKMLTKVSDTGSEPSDTYMMEFFIKIVHGFLQKKAPSQILDLILNAPLVY